MEDETLEAIRDVKAIVLENNKILKGMRRSARIAMVWHVFYWTIIIGSVLASYYFLQPYLGKVAEAYKNMQAAQQQLSNLPQSLRDSINKYLPDSGVK